MLPSFWLGLSFLVYSSIASASPLFYDAALQFLNNTQPPAPAAVNAVGSTSKGPSSISSATSTNHTNPYIQDGKVPLYTTCQKPGTFAMTFDDGTQPSQAGIRDLLDQNNIKGTFFVNGMNYECIYDPAMVAILQATYAAGHEIGNHGWSHDHSSQLSVEDFTSQVALVEEALAKILGIRPAIFRPPYGDYDDANLQVLASRNYSLAVIWDQVSGSGTGTSVSTSEANYAQLASTYPAPHIVLQHEQDDGTPNLILPQAIQELKAAGYQLVTVSECLGVAPYQWVGKPQKRDASWTCAGKPAPGAPHRH